MASHCLSISHLPDLEGSSQNVFSCICWRAPGGTWQPVAAPVTSYIFAATGPAWEDPQSLGQKLVSSKYARVPGPPICIVIRWSLMQKVNWYFGFSFSLYFCWSTARRRSGGSLRDGEEGECWLDSSSSNQISSCEYGSDNRKSFILTSIFQKLEEGLYFHAVGLLS